MSCLIYLPATYEFAADHMIVRLEANDASKESLFFRQANNEYE